MPLDGAFAAGAQSLSAVLFLRSAPIPPSLSPRLFHIQVVLPAGNGLIWASSVAAFLRILCTCLYFTLWCGFGGECGCVQTGAPMGPPPAL